MELDRIDRRIVAALMADASLPVARLAHQVGLSQTPCWKRVRRLQEAGVIRAKVALVDPERLGFGLTVLLGVSAPDQSADWQERFLQLVSGLPQVMEAWQMAGQHDYVLRLALRDMAEFEALRSKIIDALPVREISASFGLKRLKAETVLPIDLKTA